MDIEPKRSLFFQELSRLRCTLYVLDEVLDSEKTRDPDEDIEWDSALSLTLGMKTSRAILLQMLLIEHAADNFPGRNQFQKALIESLRTLYGTGDISKARAVFLSRAKAATDGTDTSELEARVKIATDYAQLVRERFFSEYEDMLAELVDGVKYWEFEEPHLTALKQFIADISYYYCFTMEGIPKMSMPWWELTRHLKRLFCATGLQQSS